MITKDEAILSAKQCSMSYDLEPTVTGNHNVARAYLFDNKSLVFAGTRPCNIHDDLTDLNVAQVYDRDLGFVHTGFYHAFKSVAKKLDVLFPNDIEIKGHSLGGAIALYYAAHRIVKGLPVSRAVTFGCPKIVGINNNRNILGDILSNTYIYCYKNGLDIIPELPLIQYYHPIDLIKLKSNVYINFLDYHYIENYIKSLEQL
jgi:predicted lipase